ncbi:hypothetical protein LVJ94_50005 [Pendulispora rubella]|uniref:HEAT repeat domain-containing protein n=1 Tax=Pendulispora rubella TaxID=2741070 RepID=A0ABZ2L247_9BACT
MNQSTKRSGGDDALATALDQAQKGDPKPLYDRLTRGSWLPGPEANLELAAAFGALCASRGNAADKVVFAMAALDADEAPGGKELEFLPMCGVAALGARAARDHAGRAKLLAKLHDSAEDLRWRVRKMVSSSLALVGATVGGALVDELDPWLDGYFHAAAVLEALADMRWLSQLHDAQAVMAIVDRAFDLARDASRSSSRYPGFKALVESLSTVPSVLAVRFGTPIFDGLAGWLERTTDPALREIVEKNVRAPRLKGRFRDEVARVLAQFEATAPARRDPRTYVGKTRGRGKK